MKPTSYVGIMTRSPSPDVRAQVGLAEGFGLLVEEVMAESPAKVAGIQQYDVLALLGDQRLVNMEQLSALIRNSAKDSEIIFTIIRAGKEQKVPVKVGETMLAAAPATPKTWGEPYERFGQQMRGKIDDMRNKVQDMTKGLQNPFHKPSGPPPPQGEGNKPMPPNNPGQPMNRDGEHRPGPSNPGGPNPRPNGDKRGQPNGTTPPQGKPHGTVSNSTSSTSISIATDGNGKTETQSQSNLIRRDDSGEYTLSETNGKKTFAVKPTSGGATTYDVSTEAQANALPEQYRDKLIEMDRVSRGDAVAGAK